VTSETPVHSSDEVHEHVEGYLPEDEAISAARERGQQLGCRAVTGGVGATLRFLTAALQARAVVEVGTGTGVSGLYLIQGMAQDGVLTSIDVEPEHQRAARKAFTDAGLKPGRTRLIMGRGLDVLPRLTDGGYDMVFVDAARSEYPRYHEQAVRLLRPGGVLGFDNVLLRGPARRDTDTGALREVTRAVRDDERLAPVLVPVGDGLLLAAKL
jgi:predicted O-methyltransferase YrrM